jgi:hypothetical protein
MVMTGQGIKDLVVEGVLLVNRDLGLKVQTEAQSQIAEGKALVPDLIGSKALIHKDIVEEMNKMHVMAMCLYTSYIGQ